MQQLTIPVNAYHSYVDLITNSSSVVYVMARPAAIDQIHEMVDNILIAGGSEVRSRDLFEITVDYDVDEWSVMDELRDNGIAWVEEVSYKDISPLLRGEGDPERVADVQRAVDSYVERKQDSYYGDNVDSYFRVNVRSGVDKHSATLAANLLSNLHGFFGYEASYDG